MITVTIRERVYYRKRSGRVTTYHVTAYFKTGEMRRKHLGSFKTAEAAENFRQKWLLENEPTWEPVVYEEPEFTAGDILRMRWA